MVFAQPTDVATAYEGLSPALPSDTALEQRIATVSARLRLLLPDLEARIAAADAEVVPPATESDLAILTRDVVVQAVIRKLPGRDQQQASSQTQQAGPFSTTVRYTVDRTGTFPDDDLDLLRGETAGSSMGPIGTIKLGRPDWHDQ